MLKRVHFANADVYYSAPNTPATPSPSHSDSSLPESDGPFTPPTVYGALPGTARLHAALAYRPNSRAALDWDVVKQPATAALDPAASPARGGLRVALSAPATNPPMPSLTLVSDLLPYVVTVNPGSIVSVPSPYMAPGAPLPRNGQYVTVGDVLAALYSTLRLPVSRAEIGALAPAPAQTAALARAYEARLSRVEDARERHVEREKGVKRIDWLIAAGATRFAGLKATPKGPDVWVLALS